MLTRSDRFEYELKRLVETAIADLKDGLAGGALEDHAAYKRMCGKIEGLRLLDDLIGEAQAICDGKER
jgi:hypothetical protein